VSSCYIQAVFFQGAFILCTWSSSKEYQQIGITIAGCCGEVKASNDVVLHAEFRIRAKDILRI
jgi:hypothetical protein